MLYFSGVQLMVVPDVSKRSNQNSFYVDVCILYSLPIVILHYGGVKR